MIYGTSFQILSLATVEPDGKTAESLNDIRAEYERVTGCGKKPTEAAANCIHSCLSQQSLICEHKLISAVMSRA